MISDRIFKNLNHTFKGYTKYYYGKYLEPGYQPDVVLRKGNKYIILESENTSSRKLFVGGMVKAAHFLQNEKNGILIFVMVPKNNTKFSSITNQLHIYFDWIKSLTNLKSVYIIEASHYYNNEVLLDLMCEDFKKVAFKVF